MALLIRTVAFEEAVYTGKKCEAVGECKALLQAKQYAACSRLEAPHSLQKMVGAVISPSKTVIVLLNSKVTYSDRPVNDTSASECRQHFLWKDLQLIPLPLHIHQRPPAHFVPSAPLP